MRLGMLLICLFAYLLPSVSFAEALFEFKGKSYQYEDLPKATQQKLYELMNQNHRTKLIFLDDYILDLYITELSKKQKKSKDVIKKEMFKVKEPTDKEIKAFYNENKDHIPYPLEKIKEQIKSKIKQTKRFDTRDTVVSKIKKDNKYKSLMLAPKAPVFDIDIAGFPAKGASKGHKVTIVEFADYQCPHCGHFFKTVKKILPKYKSKVKFVYADFPINRSGISTHVAQGAYCAGKQKKYWEFHGMAFDNQKSLSMESSVEFSKKLKLNAGTFKKCLDSKEAKDFIEKGKKLGESVAVSGTPGVFINGVKLVTGLNEKSLEAAIKKHLQ